VNVPARATATLPASRRLRTQHHFRAVYQRGRRAAGAWLTVVVLGPRSSATPSNDRADRPDRADRAGPVERGNVRLGVSVSKDHGGAVRRNKLKRLLREAFRLERHALPPGVDIVLIPRQRPDDFPLAAMRDELVRLVQKALQQPRDAARRRRE
jgi:ribonuclease P protein component